MKKIVSAPKGITLLDIFTLRAGCSYLCELRAVSPWRLYQLATELPQNECPTEEWLDAAAYLGVTAEAETPEQARLRLLKKLARQIVSPDPIDGATS